MRLCSINENTFFNTIFFWATPVSENEETLSSSDKALIWQRSSQIEITDKKQRATITTAVVMIASPVVCGGFETDNYCGPQKQNNLFMYPHQWNKLNSHKGQEVCCRVLF